MKIGKNGKTMKKIINSLCNTVLFDREIKAKYWIKEYQPQLTDEQVNNTYNNVDDMLKKRISEGELLTRLVANNVQEFSFA